MCYPEDHEDYTPEETTCYHAYTKFLNAGPKNHSVMFCSILCSDKVHSSDLKGMIAAQYLLQNGHNSDPFVLTLFFILSKKVKIHTFGCGSLRIRIR